MASSTNSRTLSRSRTNAVAHSGSGAAQVVRRTVAGTLGLALTAVFALLSSGSAFAAGPTTVSNTAAISVPSGASSDGMGPAAPFPSTVNVSGVTGPVGDVTVTLNNLTHSILNDVDALLVAPNGRNLLFLSDAGGDTFFPSATNATLTFSDAATQQLDGPGDVASGTYKPVNDDTGLEDSGPGEPTPSTATTFAEAFSGINPNGTWSLYVYDDTTGDIGTIAGGWSLTITPEDTSVATTTDVNSSNNPSLTGESVTLSATVDAAGEKPTGTVTFSADGKTIGSPVTLDANGKATITTATLAEGSHLIRATYSGNTGFLPSNGTLTQVVDSPTTVTGSTYCNTGSISTGDNGPGAPYPSRINVTNLPGTVVKVTAELSGFGHPTPVDTDVLLAGPDPTKNAVLLSDVGGISPVTGVDLTFDDDATSSVPTGSLGSGSYRPTDDDSDGQDVFPAPAPAPATAGKGLSIFDGTDAEGTWSLYVLDDAAGDTGSIADGWCLTFTMAVQTTTTITASPSPAEFGQPVTLTATTSEAGGDAVDSGQVEFFDGTTSLGTGTVKSGVATLTTRTLPLGNRSVTAAYQGDGAYQPSTSAAIAVDVVAATTTTAVAAAPDPATLGQDVVITATVTSHGDPVTTGSVTFTVGSDVRPPVDLDGQGQAAITVPAATAATQQVAAAFAGTTAYEPSTDQTTLAKLTTTTAVAASPQSSQYGDAVTLTATVTSGAEPVTDGAVEFTVDGGDPLPDVALDPDGTATVPAPALGVGSHTIKARYLGTDLFAASTDSAPQTVAKASSTTVVTADPAATAYGESVSFTAAVTSNVGEDVTGDVTFTIDGTTIDTVPVTKTGRASISVSDLSVGDHDVVASYGGSDTLRSSDSSPLTYTVSRAATTVNLTADPNPAELGQRIRLSAAVTSNGTDVTIGTVTFSDGGNELGTASVGSDGTATLTTTDLAIGTHPVTARYEQSASYSASTSAPADVVVTKISTAVTLTAQPAVPQVGDDVTYTAQVAAGADPVTAGEIRFLINGDVVQAAEPIDTEGKVAFTTTVTTARSRTITAEYLGTARYAESSAELDQTPGLGATATTLTSDSAPSTFGDDVTFTAAVTTATPDPAKITDGTVTFTVDGQKVGTEDLGSDGSASITVPDLAAGDHEVRADFDGNADYATSHADLSQQVEPAPTQIALTADPASPADDGADVTVTAEVSSGDHPVTGGTVQLTVDDHDPLPGSLDDHGTAHIHVGTLAPGSYHFEVVYRPDDNHLESPASLTYIVDPVADPGGPYKLAEGEKLELHAGGPSNDADLSWDLDGDGAFDDATGADPTLTWSQLEDLGIDDGPADHTVVLQVSKNGRTATATARLEIKNTAPTTIIDGPRTATVGKTIKLKISADDPSVADAKADFTYTVDWGDGSPVQTVVGPADPPVEHVYAKAGTMTARFFATDKDGGAGDPSTIEVAVAPKVAPTTPSGTPTPRPTPAPSGTPTAGPSRTPSARPSESAPESGSPTDSTSPSPSAPTAGPTDNAGPSDGQLADTGSDLGLPALIGGWLLMLTGGLVVALNARRRRRPARVRIRR